MFAVIVIVLIVLFVPNVFKKGIASAHYFKSQYYLGQWIKGKTAITEFAFNDAHEAAQSAVDKDPFNAHYLLNLAKVKEWGWSAEVFQPTQKNLDELYLKAIALRPKWVSAYGDYAYSLAFLQQDAKMAFLYLHKANDIVPFEETVLQNTVLVGEYYWSSIDYDEKVFVMESAFKILETNNQASFEYVKAIIVESDKKQYFCQFIKNKSEDMSEKANQRFEKQLCR